MAIANGMTYTMSGPTASFTTAPRTLAYIEVATDVVVILISTEVVAPDNDTNEQLDIAWQRITTLGTPTATTIVPRVHQQGFTAAGSVTRLDVTASEPTTYTAATEIGRAGASSLGGWRYEPAPEERIAMSPDSDWGLRILTTMGTAKILTVRFTFMELGG